MPNQRIEWVQVTKGWGLDKVWAIYGRPSITVRAEALTPEKLGPVRLVITEREIEEFSTVSEAKAAGEEAYRNGLG